MRKNWLEISSRCRRFLKYVISDRSTQTNCGRAFPGPIFFIFMQFMDNFGQQILVGPRPHFVVGPPWETTRYK